MGKGCGDRIHQIKTHSFTRVNMHMTLDVGKEDLYGKMVIFMREIFKMMKDMDMELWFGRNHAIGMKDSGRKVR